MTGYRGQDAKRASSDVERALATDGFFADELSVETAPSRDDSYEVRAAWAGEAVALAAAQNIDERRARIALPDDIRPSHFWEVEFQSALVDPVAYARSMRKNPRVLN